MKLPATCPQRQGTHQGDQARLGFRSSGRSRTRDWQPARPGQCPQRSRCRHRPRRAMASLQRAERSCARRLSIVARGRTAPQDGLAHYDRFNRTIIALAPITATCARRSAHALTYNVQRIASHERNDRFTDSSKLAPQPNRIASPVSRRMSPMISERRSCATGVRPRPRRVTVYTGRHIIGSVR